jgi:hypothetical protein
MVSWLDEERRKDKALITRLEERASAQTALIEDQSRRIQKLEGEIAQVRSALINPAVIEEAVSRIRTEFASVAEQVSARRDNAEQEMKRVRDADRETMLRAIEELRQEFNARLERELQIRRTEEERLSRVAVELQAYASNLSRGLEEFERSLTFLEEQRRQDSRRISDMSGEIIDLAKRIESQKPKIELLEELSRRNERNLSTLSGDLVESKQQRQTWAEQEALASQDRERIMADMLHRLDGFSEDMESYAKQVAGWWETQHTMKKQIEDFDRLADRVDRRLNEVAEVQRLSEERFRQEWDEWNQDDQKRWRQFTLTNEESRREQQRWVDELQAQMIKINEQAQIVIEHIKRLRVNQQDIVRNMANMAQTIRENVEDMSSLPPLS